MDKNKTSDRCIWMIVILWLICLLFMFSCKTKKVITNEQKESHVKTEQLYTSVWGVSVDSTGVSFRKVNILRYVYSLPDSAGKQHLQSIEQIAIDESQESNVSTTIKDTTSLYTKVDSVGKTETKIKEVSESLASQLTKLVLVVLVLIVVIWLIYLKFFH